MTTKLNRFMIINNCGYVGSGITSNSLKEIPVLITPGQINEKSDSDELGVLMPTEFNAKTNIKENGIKTSF